MAPETGKEQKIKTNLKSKSSVLESANVERLARVPSKKTPREGTWDGAFTVSGHPVALPLSGTVVCWVGPILP